MVINNEIIDELTVRGANIISFVDIAHLPASPD